MNLKISLLCALITSAAAQVPSPSAQEIMEGARMSVTLTQLDEGLSGSLRKSGTSTPITLFLRGKDIQFQFTQAGSPLRIFHLRIADENFSLFEMINGTVTDFPSAKIVEPIAGTDLTYEDLALRFFYWPKPLLEGIEKVGSEPCYKIRIDKPRGAAGRYEVVYVWVHTKYGAFMKITGHDRSGGKIKEFQVEDVMKVSENLWTIRKMQVATCDPANEGRRTSLTDLVFDAPKKSAPRGLR